MSNDAHIELEFPEADVRDLFRQMDMGVKYLRMHEAHALNSAARAVAQALGTSTRIAPKYRDIKEVPDPSARRNLKTFQITGWFGRPRRLETRTVRAQSKMNAKRKHAAIRRRGLAKQVWSRIGRKFGGMSAVHTLSAGASEISRLADRMGKSERGDGFVKMTNFLGYAVPALQGGPHEVSTAMERAARSLQKSFESQLVRRMGLGKLSR